MWFLLNTCVRTCTLLFTKCSERTISKREELTELEGQVIVDHEPEFSNLALDTIGFGVFNFDFDSSVLKFQPWAGRRDCSSSSTPSAAGNARRRSTTRKSSLCLKLLAWASPCKVQHANMGAFPWILSSLFLFSHGFCGYIDPFCSWSVSETECQGHAREVASSLDLGKYDGIVCVSGDGVLVEVSGASPMLQQPVLCSEYLSA